MMSRNSSTRRQRGSGACPAALLAGCCLLLGCAHPGVPRGTASAWRAAGPVLEDVRSGEPAGSLLAVRPLFSHAAGSDGVREETVTDVLWPWATFHRRGSRLDWRVFPAYGSDGDLEDPASPYRFRLFPIYYEGRTDDGETYCALFPLGGTVADLSIVGRARFLLFPLYGESDHAGTHTFTLLWPFFLTRHGETVEQVRCFPFFGWTERKGTIPETRRFVLWPIWTEAHFRGERVNGDGFVLFPLYGQTRFPHEQSWMLLPPFFSYVRNDEGYRRVRCPWPVGRWLDAGPVHERALWPLFGWKTLPGRTRGYAPWPIVQWSRDERADETLSRFHVAPLYYAETRTRGGADGEPSVCTSRYHRLWPLFSWSRTDAGSRLRVPELTLFRNNEAIERNWAPLWSLFVRRTRADGSRSTDLLWGLAAWGRDADRRRFLQLLWALHVRGAPPASDTAGKTPPP